MPSTEIDPDRVAELIRRNAFSMRQLSWTAREGRLFFKIPRRSVDLRADARSESCRQEIRTEFELLRVLANLSDHVIRPVGFVEEYSCLVLPDLDAENLRNLLRSARDSESRETLLRRAVGVIAAIHRQGVPSGVDLPALDYQANQWLPAPSHLAAAVERVVVVDGYELRNLLVDRSSGAMYLVDPHHVSTGFPEQDVARFIVSLLMLNWGRHLNCSVWTGFEWTDLIREYRNQSGRSLDPERLAYCFAMIVAMRFYHSNRSLTRMNPVLRSIGRAYQKAFFFQVRRWGQRHGLAAAGSSHSSGE
jgi:hypothetical protein